MREEVIEQHGRGSDILVNNAGIDLDKTVRKMAPEEWSHVIEVNLNGAFYMSRWSAVFTSLCGPRPESDRQALDLSSETLLAQADFSATARRGRTAPPSGGRRQRFARIRR